MNHSVTTEEIEERAALYALGALSQHEARAFETHLGEGCEVCASELARFEGTVAAIAYDSEYSDPPAYLRDLLMSRIQREPSIPGRKEFRDPQTVTVGQERSPRELTAGSSGSQPKRAAVIAMPVRSVWATMLPWAVAAVFAVTAAAAFFAWRGTNLALTTARQQAGMVEEDASKIHSQLDTLNARLMEQAQIISALESPGAVHIDLNPANSGTRQGTTLYWNRGERLWIVSAHLPPAPPGKVYQLWFVTSPAPVSAGLIKTDSSGHGFLVAPVPAQLNNVTAAAITLEPEGGSKTPTMPILLIGKTG
ncbi:MAG TPA: anti-sigma factor [Blastocatellia bacterium]|nr:anti-sigma factor [Blastocatellia bacterium]